MIKYFTKNFKWNYLKFSEINLEKLFFKFKILLDKLQIFTFNFIKLINLNM